MHYTIYIYIYIYRRRKKTDFFLQVILGCFFWSIHHVQCKEQQEFSNFIPKDSKDEVLRVVHQVFNAFLHSPTKRLKSVNELEDAQSVLDSMKYVFDIEEKLDMEN